MSLNMSRAEREEFLAGLHVGVLAVASAGGTGPLTVPVWYTYQPGRTVNLSTGRDTRKALAIAAAGRFSLCVQDERPPYKYVPVEGPAVMAEAADATGCPVRGEVDPTPNGSNWARRYLGIEGGDAYLAAGPAAPRS